MGKARSAVEELLPLVNSSRGATRIMEGWPKSILLELDGEEKVFYLVIEKGNMRLLEELDKEPDLIMHGDAEKIAEVFRGDKDITHPLAHGQLVLGRGKSIELVVFLSRILGAVHRKKMEVH